MAVPKFITNDMKGGYVGGPTTPARRCYVGSGLVYQGFSPASEQEFIEQEATGGPAQLLKVYGKSIVWRQSFKNYASAYTSHDVTITPDSDGYMTFTGTASANITLYLNGTPAGGLLTNGHKVFTGLSVAGGSLTGSGLLNITASSGGGVYSIGTAANFIVSVAASDNSYPKIAIASGTAFTNLKIRIVNIDLTLLYGAGNEPSTAEQFLTDYPTYNPAYDPGSLQSNKTAELRADDGGNLRGSLALNLSTLTGKLNGEGASVVVFPDGMRGVGTDRDKAYGSTGEVARTVVDLGTLSWTYSARGFFASTSNLPNLKNQTVGYLLSNLACSKYAQDTASNIYSGVNDKVIGTAAGGPNFWVRDSAYTDAATFKAAMSGVMVDYPIVTPLTYTLDTPLPTDLTCEQGDKLQRVSDNNCPFVGEMKFGL